MIEPQMIFTDGIRLGFGGLFLASGGSKYLRASSILHVVAGYRILPRIVLPIAARMLGPIEASAGLMLLASLFLPIYAEAWALSAGLLSVFSIAILSALVRGIEIPCGCGLVLNGHVVTPATLARNTLLLWLLILDAPFAFGAAE